MPFAALPQPGSRAVSVGLAVVVLAGCSGQAAERGLDGRGAVLPPAEFAEPGVVHVHGLGVDPADGTLYAATHSGLFALPEGGPAARVANRYQDTMGFTVVGPGRFLGSGHPDPREDDVRPPLLGLIESTDAGQRWERLSLHGEADFHGLQQAHGKVYGYDSTSQTFMVTADKRTWDRRARLVLGAFVVSPDDADRVLAVTERGLAESGDGGRTFTAVPAAPALVVLSWSSAALVGVAADGTTYASVDGGTTWQRRGTAGGTPEAVVVAEDAGGSVLYVATAERGILQSRDGGRTWTVRYAEPG